jgi:hypothetical protein
VGDAGTCGSTDCDWIAGQIGFRDGGKSAVLLMANVDKLDLTVAPQAVDDGIEGMILLSVLDLFEASDLADYTPEELAGSSQDIRNH